MIAIVDYGLGNVRAIENVYRQLGVPTQLAKTPADLENSSKIILPGVGSFDWAMEKLEKSDLVHMLNAQVLDNKKPVLGICVGMQIMARVSDEGVRVGLGWLNADVRRFGKSSALLPHMGWNDVEANSSCPLFSGISDPLFYFLHSFYLEPDDLSIVVAKSRYGISFASSVVSQNIYATQFHPEKSHSWGIRLLKNFAEFC